MLLHQIMTKLAVVNAQAVFKGVISDCEELAVHFVNTIVWTFSYKHANVICDNYDVVSSLKENTQNRRTKGKSKQLPEYKC